MISSDNIKTIISHFDRNAFVCFFNELLSTDKIKTPQRISDTIWASQPDRFFQSEEAYFLQYYPVECFEHFALEDLKFTSIIEDIIFYQKNKKESPWQPIDGSIYYIINNFDTREFNIDDNDLLAYYESKLKSENIFLNKLTLGLGNANTFLSASNNSFRRVSSILKSFTDKYKDGLCISITKDQVTASNFIAQKEFPGANKSSLSLIQPVIKNSAMDGVIGEFNELINSDTSEHLLEEFLHDNYRELFGFEYDRIETQLWLRFPELDIGQKERRLDIFMRNAVKEDWDLFELKKSNVEIAKSITDVPMFTSTVYNAIAQVKNYQHLLSQDVVKRSLAKDGIEYYEPEVNIVIGRRPSISHQQWRRMIAYCDHNVRILTYDQLLHNARIRLETASELFNKN